MLLQKRQELLLETPLAMMLGLRPDVRNRMVLLRNSDGECAVSFLPREIAGMFLVHPSRRRSLHELHGLRNGHDRGQGQQNVNVVFRAADHQSCESILTGDPSNKRPQIRLDFRRDQVPA